MKTNSKIFGRSNVSQDNRTAHGKEKGGINMVNGKQMSHDAEVTNKEENKMKTVKGKLRYFKEMTIMVGHAFKAGWNDEDFDAESFVEERGFDTLLMEEEEDVKAAEDTSKAAKREKELKDFYASLDEDIEPKKTEVEPPVKEEESVVVEETAVDETPQKPEEAPEVGKVHPIPMKGSKLFNHVGKFGSEGIRRVKGGYQRVKGKVLGLAAKSSFRKNILANAKMLSAGILAMYSGLILSIESIYIFGLLTMILSLRVVLPVVIVLGLIELFVFGLGKYNSFIVRETLSSLKGMFAKENREEEANA